MERGGAAYEGSEAGSHRISVFYVSFQWVCAVFRVLENTPINGKNLLVSGNFSLV